MSFSRQVKEELYKQIPQSRHCRYAEIQAYVHYCGRFFNDEEGKCRFFVHSESELAVKKCFTLLEKTFSIGKGVTISPDMSEQVGVHFFECAGDIVEDIRDATLKKSCCKRAYLRGIFLTIGSISDPKKSYHLELVCPEMKGALEVQGLMREFGLEGKIVQRKGNFVVYLKEGSQIVDMLNIIGAHKALMELENVRILKELRNTTNRKLNCEMANINKTVSASVKQREDIKYIRDTIGIKALPENLQDVALTRLQYPEATLKELGDLMENPLGKSGVNHRLRRISEIADKLRDHKEE